MFQAIDPLAFQKVMWPKLDGYDTYLYSKQREIIYSVEHNDITVVPAANKMGKDFVAGFIAVSYFLRYPQVRIITTSVKDDHLRVLWAEIQRFMEQCRFPLLWTKKQPTGCLYNLHRDTRKVVSPDGKQCPVSYLRGMVSERGEGLAGHHAPYTLAIVDEASGVDDIVFTQLETWAKRILVFGNPLPTTNWFYKAVKEGDLERPTVVTL
jgi:hypothetical protein